MSVESVIHEKLLDHPKLKKVVKRCYQKTMCLLSKNIKSEGKIIKISPDDNDHDYFFGYYDKSPWDISNRYMLCMKVKDTSKEVCPKDTLEILLIDTQKDNKAEKIAESRSWNVQQGCMAQWLGPDYSSKIIYNDFRDNKYCSVILDVFTHEEKVIDMPVYSVSNSGKFALTLDFSRLHRLRPGYGYNNLPDLTANEKIPDATCMWIINLENNDIQPYLNYKDFYNFETRDEMINAEHKINHIMISPNDDKFMVIHRWYLGNKKYSRLITCDISTKEMYNLSDDNMVSHCYWKNNDEIIAFENKKEEGNGYYIMKDKTREYEHIWKNLKSDGHPSYSPDGSLVLTDSYPNKKRICTIKIFSQNEIFNIAKVFAPFKYDNDTRCDLHPRWSRDNNQICFDGCFEGKRGLYVVNVESFKNNSTENLKCDNKKNNRYKVLFLMTSCKKCGPTNQTLNIIKNLDLETFEPYLLTIYEEENNSVINDYLPFVIKHFTIVSSKKQILLKKAKRLTDFITDFNPDIVHTVGLFPNYYMSTLKNIKQITTLRNYVYDDYLSKFGKLRGFIMAKLQLKAIKNTSKVVTCSKSLSDIYYKELGLEFDYIQNGVDTDNYKPISKDEKIKQKETMNISQFKTIFIYTGQFIKRKNIHFLLDNFSKLFEHNCEIGLVLLGDGPLLNQLKLQYKKFPNIIFLGNKKFVVDYLNASDYYISTSLSEGLPNGALEALACGLPVFLSDIDQHKELFMYEHNIGKIYKGGDTADFRKKMFELIEEEYSTISANARKNIMNNFSSRIMSKKYQDKYCEIIKN